MKLVHVNSLLLPLVRGYRRENGAEGEGMDAGMNKKGEQQQRTSMEMNASKEDIRASRTGRSSPRKLKPGFYFSDEDISDEDRMSDFVVDDLDGDLGLPVPRSPRKGNNGLAGRPRSPVKLMSNKHQAIDLISPEKARPMPARPVTPPEEASRQGALGEEYVGRLKL